MHEIIIFAPDENGNYTKKIREGIKEEFEITYKLIPDFIKEIYNCWVKLSPTENNGTNKTIRVIFDGLEYRIIEHYWD